MPVIQRARELLRGISGAEILWASVREVLNIVQAEESGCHIVTVPLDLLTNAFAWFDKPLDTVSLETVEMFYQDAARSGYRLTPV